MGKYTTVIAGTSALVFFAAPIFSGDASVPQSSSAIEVGIFIGSILGYWTDVLLMVLKDLV